MEKLVDRWTKFKETSKKKKRSILWKKAMIETAIMIFLACLVYLVYYLVLLLLVYLTPYFGGRFLYFGGWAGIPIAPIVAILIIYFSLASRNRWFTFVKEGTAKIVVLGDKVVDVLIQFKGYTLDDDWNIILEDTWTKNGKTLIEKKDKLYEKIGKKEVEVKKEEATEPRKEPWHPLGGLRYYGFYPFKDIYGHEFRWTGVTEDNKPDPHPSEEEREKGILKEHLDYIMVKDDVYYAILEEAEDVALLPLDLGLLFTIRIVNPYKALFKIENWLETVLNRSRTKVRNIITNKAYDDWIKNPEAIETGIKTKLKEKDFLEKEFIDRYGVEIRAIEVKKINPPDECREATLKGRVAEYDRKRILVEADAEAKRLERVGEGESKRIEKVYGTIIKKYGIEGERIRGYEAAEKATVPGSLLLIPGLQEAAQEIFGRATVSSEDIIEKLPQLIKKLRPEDAEKLIQLLEKKKKN